MTTLQLQVEIDSDAHPELYAVLSTIGKASLGPERLRQLAAGGIIWEHLRAQPRLDAGASAPTAATARAVDQSALQRALARTHAAPPTVNPPLLQDVVDMTAHPAARLRSRGHAATDVTRPPPAEVTAEPGSLAGPMPAKEPTRVPDASPGAATHKAGPRSRLLLMKERGLFTNT